MLSEILNHWYVYESLNNSLSEIKWLWRLSFIFYILKMVKVCLSSETSKKYLELIAWKQLSNLASGFAMSSRRNFLFQWIKGISIFFMITYPIRKVHIKIFKIFKMYSLRVREIANPTKNLLLFFSGCFAPSHQKIFVSLQVCS